MGISSSQNTLKIHCGFNGLVNKMTWTDVNYSQKQCVGVKVLTSVYKMSATPESKENKCTRVVCSFIGSGYDVLGCNEKGDGEE